MAWLFGIILPIIKPALAWFIGVFTKDLIAYLKDYLDKRQKAKEAAQAAQKNIDDLKSAIKNGDLDAQAKAANDILNGFKP